MSATSANVRLGELLSRVKNEVLVSDDEIYARLTIQMNGKGIIVRDNVPGHEIATKRQFEVRSGQLLLSKIDARNGAFGIIPIECDKAIITGNFWAFDINASRLVPHYFNYLTKTPLFLEFCIRSSEGTTNRLYLQEKAFLSQEIPLPPLFEQRRIVAKIDELAAKVEEAKGFRQDAIQYSDIVITAALQKIKETALAINSSAISSCSNMSTGTTPPSMRSDYFGGGINWYTPGDLSFDKRLKSSSRTISEKAVQDGKARIFEPDTILLVGIGGSLGKVALANEKCSANQQITGIKFSSEILPEYGYWWIRALYNDLRAAAPQATLPIINQRRIGEFPISVLPKDAQCRIVAYLDGLQAQVDALKKLQAQTAAELTALLPAILDRAFKGEL